MRREVFMPNITKKRIRNITVCLFFALGLLVSFSLSAQTDEELKKKYAPIIGEYEFDLVAEGMGVVRVDVYIESGSLWALPEVADSPGELLPVEGKEFEFTVEDPDSGTFYCKFLKDEQGQYTQFQLINEMMGIDSTGIKIKQ
jgi:hypothetical protein